MNFPMQNQNQRKGRKGESRFADFVVNSLNCIYHKIDGSDDFGIDGHIEIVANNAVTGRYVAVQVKHGNSYFAQKTESGYKFVGKDKHLNYYLNSPVPVFIVIMDDNFERMLWVHFELAQILPVGSDSWWIEMPENNTLEANFANSIFTSVGNIIDYSELVASIKCTNSMLNDVDTIAIGISKDEVNTLDFSDVMATFEALSRNKTIRNKFMSACSLFFPEYDDDPREIIQIPEVMQWLKKSISYNVPWFYFLDTSKTSGIHLLLFAYANPLLRPQKNGFIYAEIDARETAKFLEHAFVNLNAFTELYNVGFDDNKKISEKLANYFLSMGRNQRESLLEI